MHDSSPPRPSLLAPRLWPVWFTAALMWLLARLPMRWIFALGKTIGVFKRSGGLYVAEMTLKSPKAHTVGDTGFPRPAP